MNEKISREEVLNNLDFKKLAKTCKDQKIYLP
jgi:hypothetical protein